jgi:hypothetical protein
MVKCLTATVLKKEGSGKGQSIWTNYSANALSPELFLKTLSLLPFYLYIFFLPHSPGSGIAQTSSSGLLNHLFF